MVYNLLFFSLQNTVCFIILTCLVRVLFTFYIQGVLKLKKNNSGAKRLRILTRWRWRQQVTPDVRDLDTQGVMDSIYYFIIRLLGPRTFFWLFDLLFVFKRLFSKRLVLFCVLDVWLEMWSEPVTIILKRILYIFCRNFRKISLSITDLRPKPRLPRIRGKSVAHSNTSLVHFIKGSVRFVL